jgi:hypothetical protein
VDIYFNGGAEYAGRAADFDPVQKKVVGYGSPLFVNTGCLTETGPGAGGFAPGGLANCNADSRVVIEATGGAWFKVYDGAREKLNWGRIQFGPQYSVVIRNTWSGAGVPSNIQGIDNMVFTSFRYYLP